MSHVNLNDHNSPTGHLGSAADPPPGPMITKAFFLMKEKTAIAV